MYKFIFRSIIATLLSVTLITQSVVAQTQTYNSDGTVTTTQTKTFAGYKDDPNWISSATMAMVGLIAVNLIRYDTWTTDIMLAMAGGVVFLIGEMASSKDVNEKTMTLVTKSAGAQDEQQLADLQKQKTAIDDALKATKTKKTMQEIARLAFLAAGVLAIFSAAAYEVAKDGSNSANLVLTANCGATTCAGVPGALTATCPAAVNTAKNVAKDQAAKVKAPSWTLRSAFSGILDKFKKLYDTMTGAFTAATTTCQAASAAEDSAAVGMTGGAASIATEAGAAKNAASIVVTKAKEEIIQQVEDSSTSANRAPGVFSQSVIVKFSPEKIKNKNIFENFMSLLFPKAQASSKESALLWGAGGAAMGYFGSSLLDTYLDFMMFTPGWRGVTWGAICLLVDQAVQASEDVIKQLQKQSDDLAAIIAAMSNTNVPTGNPGAGPGSGPIIPPGGQNAPPPFDVSPQGGDKTFPCVLPGAAAGGKCPSMASAFNNNPGLSNVPPDIAAMGSGFLTKMDNALASKAIGPSSFGSPSQMSADLKTLNGMLGKAQSTLNDQLTKMGKPTIDFAKETKDIATKMNGITQDALNKSGMTASQFLASHGGSGNGSTTPATGAGKGSGFAASGAGKMAGKGAGAAGGSASSGGIKIPNFNLKADDTGSDPAAAVTATPNTMDQFELAKGDINKDSGASLFQIISERYIKTGYPILFEEVPVKVPLAPPAEKK